jgi:predicted nucleic acid-binding protein
MKKKLYIETSVWNQITHTDRPDWKRATQEFFNTIKTGVYEIFVSELVLDEIAQTSNQILREQLRKQISELQPTMLDFDTEARALVDQYRSAAIIKSDKPKIIVDLGHVAIATVNGIRHIISFNFDHLVNEIKIDKFNSVNLNVGYDVIVDIKTPESYIIRNEEEDV